MDFIKIIKNLLPANVLVPLKRIRKKRTWKDYEQLTTKEVFTKIYTEHVWGSDGSGSGSFFSGGGSHDTALIEPYVSAVKKFLLSFPNKPDVVDLGCGDFNTGSQIRAACNKYIACDIVDSVIEQNRTAYQDVNVDFRVFDLTKEKCEKTDVVFLRQVLQHLSNKDIEKGLKNIIPYCRYLVLTEHVPARARFKKNLDKPSGPDVRAEFNSGIDITTKPFGYHLKGECICEVPDGLGLIKTIVYKCS